MSGERTTLGPLEISRYSPYNNEITFNETETKLVVHFNRHLDVSQDVHKCVTVEPAVSDIKVIIGNARG